MFYLLGSLCQTPAKYHLVLGGKTLWLKAYRAATKSSISVKKLTKQHGVILWRHLDVKSVWVPVAGGFPPIMYRFN